MKLCQVWLAAACACCFFRMITADELKIPLPEKPGIAEKSAEGEQALAGFRLAEGIEGKLIAAEPDLANPVAFTVDNQGRIFVCETFRQGKGVEDNRNHGAWLDDDLAAQTVEDRLAYLKKHLGDNLLDYAKQDDRIRLLEDTDGDLVMDKATVFAEHFNHVLEGTGAGVLNVNGNIYYTCIPHLYLLRDDDGDGKAEVRKKLHSGYGVRFAFRGHDMHGLTIGPDGRIYYSIGDRGFNVKTKEGKHFVNPGSGGVFRCELDGSNLEVIATGMRNPQELAFDDYGNLFTCDNNSDSGDKARCVYVAEGGDTGWRMAYQYFGDRGPFNREKIWHPYSDETPAYIVPPITNFADGPSGLAYYPGTGFGDRFKGCFFLCDFRGGPGNSGVRSFRVKNKGAFFEQVDTEEPIWKILATDVDFGPDGGMYVSDWVNGWNGLGKGRIYRFFDPGAGDEELVAEVKDILNNGLGAADEARLAKLLGHTDRRVRLEAQFELVRRDEVEALATAAKSAEIQLARLHGLWGLAQAARLNPKFVDTAIQEIAPLLTDKDPEVAAHAANALGPLGAKESVAELIEAVQSADNRIAYFAAQSLGKLQAKESLPAILARLEKNADEDPILRHGLIMALESFDDPAALVSLKDHSSASVRLAAVVALRGLESPEIAAFLGDIDARVVLETARAIHDVPIATAMPALAELIARKSDSDPLLRRVLNANYRLGGAERAEALAFFAARADAPENMRLEALTMLKEWASPGSRDRVLGMWRPIEPRDAAEAAAAIRVALPQLLTGAGKVRTEATQTAAALGINEVAPLLVELIESNKEEGSVRAQALTALASLDKTKLDSVLEKALESDSEELRAAGLPLFVDKQGAGALDLLLVKVEAGGKLEKQAAVLALGKINNAVSDQILTNLVKGLAENQSPEAGVEVFTTAKASANADVKEALAKYEASLPADDPLAKYRLSLHGGNAAAGKQIFLEKTAVSCVRCHRVDGVGGLVGPDLSKIAKDKDREYLLQSIVDPNAKIAKDFESVLVLTFDGQTITGVLKKETGEALEIMTAEGKLITVKQDDIEARKKAISAMPADLLKELSLVELRNLVEFLSSQK